MLFYVTYEDKKYAIRVESRPNRLLVAFEDEPEERVDLIFQGNDCTFIRENRVFYANIRGDKENYTVWRPHRNLNFSVESEYKQILDKLRGQTLEKENIVSSKMPGKILKVLTKEGGYVNDGDAVIIMEAMKMENEIRTTLSGKVSKIYVKKGDTVDSGAQLLEIEPEE